MIPAVFIGLVTLVLIGLVYWVLSTAGADEQSREAKRKQDYKFETAGELFKYVEPDAGKDKDILSLKAYPHYILASWNINPGNWEAYQHEYGAGLNADNLLIRLYESGSGKNHLELPVQGPNGSCYLKSKPDNHYYGVMGIKSGDEFIPIITSNTRIKNERTIN